MSALTRRNTGPLAELFDWFEAPLAVFHPSAAQYMRLEDFVRDGHYVVRAELPGLDPDKQLEVTVSKGILTIKANREEHGEAGHRSEFRYGVFVRQIRLPEGADEAQIRASYDKGILEIDVGLKGNEPTAAQHRIPVRELAHIPPT
jgi:HSP20 family protein